MNRLYLANCCFYTYMMDRKNTKIGLALLGLIIIPFIGSFILKYYPVVKRYIFDNY